MIVLSSISSNMHGFPNHFNPMLQKNMSYSQIVPAWLLDCRARGLSPTTLKLYRDVSKLFLAYAKDDDSEALSGWAAKLFASKRRSTAASYSRTMLSALRWWAESTNAPLPRIRIRAPKGPPKARDLRDVAAVMAAAEPHTALLVAVLLDSGMRIAEARSVRWRDYDTLLGTFYIVGKGARPRCVAVGRRTAEMLSGVMQGAEDLVFPRPVAYYRREMRRASVRAGVAKLTPHAVRHSLARSWLQTGGDLASLQVVLGHSTPAMTLHYARMYGVDAVKRQRELSPVDRLEALS